MKGVTEKSNSCTCYGCIKRSSCKCSNCVLNKDYKTSFCLYENNKQATYECNVCFSKFRTFEYLKKHRKKTNHWKKTSNNEDLPKAKWIDFYMCGDFENDREVKRMTKSKILRYKTTFKKSE